VEVSLKCRVSHIKEIGVISLNDSGVKIPVGVLGGASLDLQRLIHNHRISSNRNPLNYGPADFGIQLLNSKEDSKPFNPRTPPQATADRHFAPCYPKLATPKSKPKLGTFLKLSKLTPQFLTSPHHPRIKIPACCCLNYQKTKECRAKPCRQLQACKPRIEGRQLGPTFGKRFLLLDSYPETAV
jgi:hypothetical protein